MKHFVKVWASHTFIWTKRRLRGGAEKLLRDLNLGGTCGSRHFGTLLGLLRNTQIFSTNTHLRSPPHPRISFCLFQSKIWCEEGVKAPFGETTQTKNGTEVLSCLSQHSSKFIFTLCSCILHSALCLNPALHAFIFIVSWTADIVKTWTEHMLQWCLQYE